MRLSIAEMTTDDRPVSTTADPALRPLFEAVLVPHRSLSPAGFGLFIGLVAAVSFVAGAMFWRMGAWPVAGFLGLDVALIALAFRLNYRDGRATEEVSVSPTEIVFRRSGPNGAALEWRLATFHARLAVSRDPEAGVTAIRLSGQGRAETVGGFLDPESRTSFAAAFEAALAAARKGPDFSRASARRPSPLTG